jgi:cellulose synthase/poly-beta-1,6-N-acetylglucosamine synthase-like glycosyltransferase
MVVLFPILLVVRSLWRRPVRKAPITPFVSFCIAAYNEEESIEAKIENVLSLYYPPDQWEAIIVSDGSTDGTDDVLRKQRDSRIRWVRISRSGKNEALNEAVRCAGGDILVFTDVDALFERGALKKLVAPFHDPRVGAVGGDYRYSGGSRSQSGERFHWGIERFLRMLQSRSGDATSATGQIYAIRKELYKPVPGGISDDFYISVQAVSSGYRLVYEPQAQAHGPITQSDAEYSRKVRVIAKGLAALRHVPHLFNPFKYGFYTLQLITHKVLRRFLAIPLILLFLSAALLYSEGPVYRFALYLQGLWHTVAVLGLFLRQRRLPGSRLLAMPFFIDLVYVAALVAMKDVLLGRTYACWRTKRAAA